RAEEDDVVAALARARAEPSRRSRHDLAHLAAREEDDARAVTERPREGALDLRAQPGRVGRARPEEDVAALDVGEHVPETLLREARPQRICLDEVLPADVDAAQQGEVTVVGHGIRLCPEHGRSRPAAPPRVFGKRSGYDRGMSSGQLRL